ncbi:MAG: Rrf2 family transcriptional regulator [Candidatus Latescibacteria bacterium]|nr:Rrf2 family transcriptional regulator [Candidatus Latescibacterota bacterium]
MLFSQPSKYALRALLHLAQKGPEPHLSREIARALDVPEPFLAKILQNLVRHKLLQSFKGRGGGFKLAKPAKRISLLAVVQAVEGPDFGHNCLLGLPECSETNPCPLHDHWSTHKARLFDMLENQTLAQALRHEKK